MLGSRDRPVTTPEGVTINDDPKGAWASLSVACDDSILPTVQAIDDRVRELLAENSEPLFGMKCTLDMINKYKFYTPLAYSKEDSSMAPLAGGKVTNNTLVEDMMGHGMMKSPASLPNLAEAIPASSKIRLIASLTSLYFSAETKCKLSVKIERIQLIEARSDVAEVETYTFDG